MRYWARPPQPASSLLLGSGTVTTATVVGILVLTIGLLMLLAAFVLRCRRKAGHGPHGKLASPGQVLELSDHDQNRIQQLATSGQVAAAVREYRRATGADLLTASRVVEKMQSD
jgi:hypothetical protein